MRIDQNNFKSNLKLKLDSNPQIIGLDAFKRSLEKEHFSEVSIFNCSPNTQFAKLVIEMKCKIELVEVLFHAQKGTWGAISEDYESTAVATAFSNSLIELQRLNTLPIDIEELTIMLDDSLIIIKKIYHNSIQEQLGNIIKTIAENYVHLTKGLTEAPYEIYIPVFEEDFPENDDRLNNINSGNSSKKDYFAFWGLYFDSEEDAVIYDLCNKSIISGDLYMLNH
ncbi:hypothetical protein [Muriicola sp. Z0-33]|uniref:hypothetical protein n=1 Tax=Muriicola sp. Z0-33 TaxID=2816957 RepID=UPI0022371444|nr:hypothetical protein [Muriicola sp. Z0-33]MCW5516565.1 hypothetical protein [Muriicola sp. Z0-33]